MIRKEVTGTSMKDGAYVETAMIYATTREEALSVQTGRLTQGSMLYVVRPAKLYVLDGDGGDWYNVASGAALTEDA